MNMLKRILKFLKGVFTPHEQLVIRHDDPETACEMQENKVIYEEAIACPKCGKVICECVPEPVKEAFHDAGLEIVEESVPAVEETPAVAVEAPKKKRRGRPRKKKAVIKE